ncbi:hypothetical protein [Williamsia sp. CHRR-6]|uniref:hypothetical protein n=1 Tax=Williamsia sp. CHRR-6 TaxID=2835871 RepID=UPI001BDB1AF9|nr:hypothetical protein [Williamsia sp. CHRR-6]MBT0568565.1 hypothetical protein [Williamsia sp. CHRR-6]
MSSNGSESLITSLGIGVDDTQVPDDVWSSMLSVAFDPNTAASDASIVPTMDDSGDLPEDDDDYVVQPHSTTDHDDPARDADHDSAHHGDADGHTHAHHDDSHDPDPHAHHDDSHHGETDWHV